MLLIAKSKRVNKIEIMFLGPEPIIGREDPQN